MIGLETKMSQRSIPSAAILAGPALPTLTFRHPSGHSYGAGFEIPERPDPEEWRACRDYLYGIEIFNHGFYWEAHEVWEGLWVACGRRGPNLPAGAYQPLPPPDRKRDQVVLGV